MIAIDEKNEGKTSNKVTLDIELRDLLDIVSKSGGKPPISETMLTDDDLSGESIRKAWFKHMLISIEKLNELIETIRREDIVSLRKEIKEELRRIDNRAEKAEDELKAYKREIIEPLKTKVTTLAVKFGIWSVVASFFGSGIVALIAAIVSAYLSNKP